MPKRVKKEPKAAEHWMLLPTEKLVEMVGEEVPEVLMAAVRTQMALCFGTSKLTVEKVGPGITTILLDEQEDGKPVYKRMALVGGEVMTVEGSYLGKRDGVIIKMTAPAGVMLGVDKDVQCEVSLKNFLQQFTIPARYGSTRPIKELFLQAFEAAGSDPAAVQESIARMREEAEQKMRETENEARRRYIAEREDEYKDKSWGAW
jgi:hypothetical protein